MPDHVANGFATYFTMVNMPQCAMAATVAPNADVDDWSFPRPRKCLAEAIKPARSGQVLTRLGPNRAI